ncbi:hypothetical protein [Chitinophaga barathri]|nr:hypothetical protein [Chitinophaga barathri]
MQETPEEKPPVFSSWSVWYWLVAGVLAALIVFFYFFTKNYS